MVRLFDTFRIGRFRGFKDVEFSGCGSTNVLIGANNSGKSSVLEAMAIFGQPSKPSNWLDILRLRGDASEQDLSWRDWQQARNPEPICSRILAVVRNTDRRS